jgi:hypothetical protein
MIRSLTGTASGKNLEAAGSGRFLAYVSGRTGRVRMRSSAVRIEAGRWVDQTALLPLMGLRRLTGFLR